ncbi:MULTISPECIES: ATP12 family chaperone protein [unclassified Paracoccus (in: a-proteobacteria)]|uniref:ATP12 family chaperone protein n=1 Tax=unclassified Paracoccus (in: a-proteobacteria) TaxID=2688777 RepID=UPI0015FECB1E|nr:MULTISPECIES: ATP12 family protein [unclassified Paracoccus (in: a-proteobacteria)]MBB1491086.1 ATPase [Paracoccus sp. MC1854]MBB1497099.1 ATPase [Paracoccus sp. MC1862]QQO44503.1 ATPase [Paracoccus sp. MC1862]
MSEWQARRFWKENAVEPVPGGYEVRLDGRPLRTPGKLPLVLPTRALALAVAAEWDAQTDVIDPGAMPLTRAANSAIERVAPQFDAVADMLAEYGGTDLLCYRAEHPVELVMQQAEGWNPLLDWARSDLQAMLLVTQGVIPVAQDRVALTRLRDRLDALSHWQLTALHDLVTLSGSLILGLAVLGGRLRADEAHRLSRIDEEHQAAIWGRDEEADIAAEGRLQALRNAARLLALLAADAASKTDPSPDA